MSVETEDVSVSIDGRLVLSPTSFEASAGSMTSIVGPSGSGKTTLLNVLGLLVRPTSGRVIADGAVTNDWNDARRRKFWRESAAFVFQDYGLIDEESVAYNVTMSNPPLFPRRAPAVPGVQDALARVDLAERSVERVSTLSGGEKQRVGIARAMFKRAAYIFVDEPTASLDLANREMVTGLLRAEANRGAAVIIATHDMTLAESCDRTLALGMSTQVVSTSAP